MFDNMCAENAIEAFIRSAAQEVEDIGLVGFDIFRAAGADGVWVEVDSDPGDIKLFQQLEEFTAAAAKVQDAAAALEIGNVELLNHTEATATTSADPS